MKNKNHMSYFGVGPVYVSIILTLTLISIYLGKTSCLSAGIINAIDLPMKILGLIIIILGILLWIQAVLISRIDKNITENKLVTTGAYAWVRNPIYSSISLMLTGTLILQNNLFLLIIPFIFWLILTLLIKKEEVVLAKVFGEEYLSYKSKVNRCISWFPKK